MPTLDEILAEADTVDTEALQTVAGVFGGMYDRISPQIELILRRLGDDPTQSEINKAIEEIQALLQGQMDGFAGYIENTLPQLEADSMQLGLSHSLLILGLFGIEGETPADAIDVLGTMLAPNSPLYKRLKMYGAYHADSIAQALKDIITNSMTTGQGQSFIANIIRQAELIITNALADAIRLVRTSLLYAYREATRLNYAANGVTQWQWLAQLDDRVCMSCVVMHGTVHSIDEGLNDHHNGRCAMIPVVDGNLLVEENAGQSWFNKLGQTQQKAMMGKGRYEAWKAGNFELPEISTFYDDSVYGQMRRETSLKELMKGN
jgi:SPP1 gp7 family putative phage head morphogenesis protein